jgi:hypothetical protein
MDSGLIPLVDAISVLRSQLAEARIEGQNEEVQFEVGPVEVEFQVVFDRSIEAGGKVGFSLFGLGSEATAGGKVGDSRTHRIKFSLTPSCGGDSFNISAKRSGAQGSSGSAPEHDQARGTEDDLGAARR